MNAWEREIIFPFQFKDKIKQIPGVRWEAKSRKWFCPEEAIDEVKEIWSKVEVKGPGKLEHVYTRASTEDPDGLREHQKRTLYQAVDHLSRQGSWFIFDEPGLGKAAVAVRVIAAFYDKTLIVCPSSVIKTWEMEMAKWWPYDNKGLGFSIVSSDSLHKVEEAGYYGLVVVDEAHMFKNPTSERTKALVKLLTGKKVLGLSGTPTPNNIQDISAMVNLLWPGRFGRFSPGSKYSFQFNHYFLEGTNVSEDDQSRWIWGQLKPEKSAYLENRIKSICTRNTWSNVEPDCVFVPNVRYVELSERERKNYYRACSEPTSYDMRFSSISEVMSQKKVDAACEWIKEKNGQKVVVYTHLKHTAESIASKMACGVITGDVTSNKRGDAIKKAEALGRPVIATMHSIGLGINELAEFDAGLFAELYWKHDVIEQAASRLRRLSNPRSPSLDFLVCVDTMDEHMVEVLVSKLQCIKRAGLSSSASSSLLEAGKSDVEILQNMFNDETRKFSED